MKTNKDDKHMDKAKERLRQFESARAPQQKDEDLLKGLDELIAKLRAEDKPLTIEAAERLTQFKNRFSIQFGFQNPPNKNPENK